MALTITEKEHWKQRIEAKIDKRIEKLKQAEPDLFKSVEEKAHRAALETLGITDKHDLLEKTRSNISELEEKKEKLLSEIHLALTGKADTCYSARNTIDNRISKQQTILEEDLLLEHETGREISRLREEKENLLDTVWLATSPRQITSLWEKVSTVLGEEATAIQKEVLANKSEIGES